MRESLVSFDVRFASLARVLATAILLSGAVPVALAGAQQEQMATGSILGIDDYEQWRSITSPIPESTVSTRRSASQPPRNSMRAVSSP